MIFSYRYTEMIYRYLKTKNMVTLRHYTHLLFYSLHTPGFVNSFRLVGAVGTGIINRKGS